MPSYSPPPPPHRNHTGSVQLQMGNKGNLISGRSGNFKVQIPSFKKLHQSMIAGSLNKRRKYSRHHKKHTRKH